MARITQRAANVLAVVIGGAILFHFFYAFPGPAEHPGLSLSVYAAFKLIFFESVLPFPERSSLQLFFYLIPVLGLLAVVDGVLQFGSTLLSWQAHGQKWQVAMASTYEDHIIVCGAGKVGYRVILELLKFEQEIVAIDVKHSFYVGETLIVISEQEMVPGSSLIGMNVSELEQGHDLSVVCAIAGGQAALHPGGGHVIAAGEALLLMSSVDIIRQVQVLNHAG